MAKESLERSHQYLARIALLILVAIPFVPEIIIWSVAAVADLMGCRPDQAEVCTIGPLAVGDIINWALQLGAGTRLAFSSAWLTGFYLANAGWLMVCYIVLILGWARVTSRLLLGLAVALVFAFLPYSGPWSPIANLAKKPVCDLNSGSACKIFGGEINGAYAAVKVTVPDLLYGILLAIGIFGIYVIAVALAGIFSARGVKPGQQKS